MPHTAHPPPLVRFPTRAIQSARRSSCAARTSLVVPASVCASKSSAQTYWPRRSQLTSLMADYVISFRRCDNWHHSSAPSVGSLRTSVWICWTLRYPPRSLAGWHPAARLQDSYNLNSCRHGTILRWENNRRRWTQLHCFTACRRLLLRALNRCSGVNRYSQCRLCWLVLGRDHSARPHLTRLNSIELNHLSWIELSQVGCCAQGFRL